jgi:hypothetical protein
MSLMISRLINFCGILFQDLIIIQEVQTALVDRYQVNKFLFLVLITVFLTNQEDNGLHFMFDSY